MRRLERLQARVPAAQPKVGLNRAGRRRGGDRWRGKYKTAEHASPLVRRFFEIANKQRANLHEISAKGGPHFDCIGRWRSRHVPTLTNFDAALNVLGYELRIVRRGMP